MGILVHNTMIGTERISDDTPLFKLTVGEFKDLCNSLIPKPKEEENDEIVYGLDGLAKIFGVSKNQAYRMKRSGKFNEAIRQEGQVIITYRKKALELFGKRK